MAAQHHIGLIDHDRSYKSEGLDAVGDLSDLMLGMGAGVPGI
jgi:hypothetical protein